MIWSMDGPIWTFRGWVLALVGAISLAAPGAVWAQNRALAGAHRVVARFDFEEPDNPFDLPGSFFRAQSDPNTGIDRPGYPIFNKARFDFSTAHSGEACVYLPIRRGSVSLRLRPGVLPVFVDADYSVNCFVKGDGLRHARFRLVCRFLDTTGQPIQDSELSTDPILPGAEWQPVELVVPGGRTPGAAFMQIDLELIQPELYEQPELGEHQIWEEDFSGGAWVDDLVVEQLPRLVLRTQTPSNIVVMPDRPELSLLVRDLTGERLVAKLTVWDHRGRVQDHQERPVQSSRVPTHWTPKISRLGWYRARVDLVSEDVVVSSVPLVLCWVPAPIEPDAASEMKDPDRGRFGISTPTFRTELLDVISGMAPSVASNVLTLGVWDSGTDPDRAKAVASKIGALSHKIDQTWPEFHIALPEVPDAVRQEIQVDPGAVLEVLTTGPRIITPVLDPLLDRLGQFVRRWRLGPLEGQAAFWSGDIESRIASARLLLAMLVPGPTVDIPWNPVLDLSPLVEAKGLGAVTSYFEAGTGLAGITDVLERWRDAGFSDSVDLTLAFGSGGSDRFGPAEAGAELVKRVIMVEAGVSDLGLPSEPGLELVRPWAWSSGLEPVFMPKPELAVWRSTIDRLRGRRVAANLSFEPGMHVYLLTPIDPASDRGGALVAWNDTADSDQAVVRLFLGEGEVRAIDMWGNQSGTITPNRVKIAKALEIEQHEIRVSREPIFIEGVDVELALFTASLRLDNPVIQTTPGPHRRAISVTNPWPIAIDGTLVINEPSPRLPSGRPSGWEISPRVLRFTAGPGETVQVPVDLNFSALEQSGLKRLVIDAQMSAGPVSERVRATSKFSLELDGVELDVRAIAEPGGTDVAVEAVVTSTSDVPMDLNLNASVRGYTRQNSTISQLAPGSTVVRRFLYPNGVSRLAGKQIFVGIEDPVRRGRLNKQIQFE